MPNPGFRIKLSFERPDPALVKSFAGIPIANIGDTMNRMACMAARIRPLNKAPLLGPAFTVKVRAGDNLMFHKAINMAEPGDIIVVDAQGDVTYATTGELMVNWCRKRKIGGLIIDGAIRDYEAISKMDDFPVYVAGVNANGPLKEGGGEINFPIMCGGLTVNPGDILVGDEDGVVVVPQADAAYILEKSRAVVEKEKGDTAAIESLTWTRPWVDEVLKTKGCEIIP